MHCVMVVWFKHVISYARFMLCLSGVSCRNFEKKTLGQIKTVYPSGYSMRQEKGLPAFGKKTTDYQLTVEPNLSGKYILQARLLVNFYCSGEYKT